MYETYEHISVDVADGVATVELHRPEVHNALNTATMLDLSRAFDELQLDRDVEVVVITGEGEEAFSAGADIEEYAGPAGDHDPRQRDRQEMFAAMYEKVYEHHAPVIAKVNGYCVGGGFILATACDLRVASDDATFGVPTANIGQIPQAGSTHRAVELVGEAKAKELVYTAGYIGAEEAHRIGLVNRVVPSGDLDAEVAELVESIQATGTGAVKASKRAFRAAADAPDRETAREREAELWWEQFASDERERLVGEFLED